MMRLRDWLADRVRPKPLGQRGEILAARYLQKKGYHMLARHHRTRLGELDLVAVDRSTGFRTIVFVEVKTRRSLHKGHPAEAVDEQKQRRLTRAGLAYLKAHGLLDYPARFDVLAILWPDGVRRPAIEHFQNAFPATGFGQFYS